MCVLRSSRPPFPSTAAVWCLCGPERTARPSRVPRLSARSHPTRTFTEPLPTVRSGRPGRPVPGSRRPPHPRAPRRESPRASSTNGTPSGGCSPATPSRATGPYRSERPCALRRRTRTRTTATRRGGGGGTTTTSTCCTGPAAAAAAFSPRRLCRVFGRRSPEGAWLGVGAREWRGTSAGRAMEGGAGPPRQAGCGAGGRGGAPRAAGRGVGRGPATSAGRQGTGAGGAGAPCRAGPLRRRRGGRGGGARTVFGRTGGLRSPGARPRPSPPPDPSAATPGALPEGRARGVAVPNRERALGLRFYRRYGGEAFPSSLPLRSSRPAWYGWGPLSSLRRSPSLSGRIFRFLAGERGGFAPRRVRRPGARARWAPRAGNGGPGYSLRPVLVTKNTYPGRGWVDDGQEGRFPVSSLRRSWKSVDRVISRMRPSKAF